MEITSQDVFCDWLTASQTHETPHQPFTSGVKTVTDENGQVTQVTALPKMLAGKHNSNIQISSDGNTVKYSGNPSRWNRSENLYGLDLDQVKTLVNKQLDSIGLPIFTSGEVLQLSNGSQKYTGAALSRVDMTINIKTGSSTARDSLLSYLQTQSFPRLAKCLVDKNVEYGKYSTHRSIRAYDKSLHLQQMVLPKTDEPAYINRLIDWSDSHGIVRFESEYHRYLERNNLRRWHQATHQNLFSHFKKDVNIMTPKLKEPDYKDLSNAVLGTLTMYMAGINVKDRLATSVYYRHRKILKEHGWDISNQNIHLLQPKVRVITLEPAGVPDFYKHATGEL